jgi:ketosteroid isomerase-like protein
MKGVKFRPFAFVLFSALLVVFCFAGRSISSFSGGPGGPSGPGGSGSTGGPGDRIATGFDSVGDDIGKIQEQIKEAFITGDSTLFLKCYAQDACVLAPNAPTLCGQQGVARFFRNTRQAGIRDGSFNSIGLFGQTLEYVTQQGAFEVFGADKHSLGKGKVLIIFKRTDEGWRIFRQMLNFDGPVPGAPAPAR